MGLRVVVGTIKDSYAAVGSIHQMWMPVQGRFKDYIAMPKYNTYQSLHTTVVGPQGKQLEVQIRTREMDLRASFGVAAHWRYKAEPDELEWLDRMIEWQSDVSDPSEFMANLKGDLDQDEVVAFTPKGEVVHLPAGATPVDFAYAIHTQIGHKCIGAKVDGSLVELSTPLRSGQTVEIFTAKTEDAGPSPDWLEWVASPKAASKIRQWLAQQRRDSVLEVGQEELERELRVRGLPLAEVMEAGAVLRAAVELNYADLDALYRAVGERHVSARAVAARVRRVLAEGAPEAETRLTSSALEPRRRASSRNTTGVHVEGMDEELIRLARCCTPVPPDPIMGFHTRGRGVSVHRADCANAVSLASAHQGRLVEVEWDSDGARNYLVSVEVRALDRTKLLRDVAAVLCRPPHQHRGVPDADRRRPGLPDALRLRGQRPVPRQRRHGDDPVARGRLQHRPGAPACGGRPGCRRRICPPRGRRAGSRRGLGDGVTPSYVLCRVTSAQRTWGRRSAASSRMRHTPGQLGAAHGGRGDGGGGELDGERRAGRACTAPRRPTRSGRRPTAARPRRPGAWSASIEVVALAGVTVPLVVVEDLAVEDGVAVGDDRVEHPGAGQGQLDGSSRPPRRRRAPSAGDGSRDPLPASQRRCSSPSSERLRIVQRRGALVAGLAVPPGVAGVEQHQLGEIAGHTERQITVRLGRVAQPYRHPLLAGPGGGRHPGRPRARAREGSWCLAPPRQALSARSWSSQMAAIGWRRWRAWRSGSSRSWAESLAVVVEP